MLRIKNTEVFNLEGAIISSALPMLSTELTVEERNKRIANLKNFLSNPDLEDEQAKKDFKRAVVLGKTKAGSGHNNYLKGIIVNFDVIYPNYWTPQMQRYHFFDIISSS